MVPVNGSDTTDVLRQKINHRDYVSITDFGADPTGAAYSTQAIVDALTYAQASVFVRYVLIPQGIFLIKPYGYMPATAIRVFNGLTLEGQGDGSVLRYHPQAYQDADANGSSYTAIFYGSDTTLANFRLDGNGPNLATTGTVTLTDVTTNAIKPDAADVSGNLCDTLWLHDLRTIGSREGFALNCTEGTTDFTWRGIRAWDITLGTGIHAACGGPLSNRVERGTLIDCHAWACGWQGIGLHASKDITIRDCKTWDNLGAGLNIEWTDGVQISDCESWDNEYGLRTIGHVKRLRAENVTLRNNGADVTGTARGIVADIGFLQGMFLDATSHGTIETAELINCSVTPVSGRPQMYVQNYNSNNIQPTTHPTKIVVEGHDAHEWFWSSGEWNWADAAQTIPILITGVQFKGTPTVASVYLKNPNQYTVSGATLSAPSSEGTTNPGATVINSTATSQFAHTPANLMPGRTYKIRFRVKQKQAEAWRIRIKRSGATEEKVIKFGQQTLDVNQWQEGEVIHTVADTVPLRVEFFHNGSSTNTQLVVDYCWAEEIATKTSSAMWMTGNSRNIMGTAAPTVGPPDGGTWIVGDKVWLETPAASGTIGWVCTTAGNPGTWKTWGTISA